MRRYLGNECANRGCYNKAEANGICRSCNRIADRSPRAIEYVRDYPALKIPARVLAKMAQ